MKRPTRLRMGIVLLVVMSVPGWFGWQALRPARAFPAERIVKVTRGSIARSVVAVGRIEPRSKVEVKSKANGIIQALLADVGNVVAEGQILAELDKENLQAQLREARATLDGEAASLEVASAEENRSRIEAANPDLQFADRDWRRSLALFEEGVASQQALDDAQRAFEGARNRQSLLEAQIESATSRVTLARARLAAARAALDRAEENLRYATIRAPIGGVVLARDTEVGDAVSSILNLGSAATLMMTLGDLSTVYVRGEVDEADVGKVRIDLPVRTTVESFPGEVFDGIVTRIAPMGRERNNVTTFEVRVSIANPDGRLRVNMSANAEIVLEEHHDARLLPESALTYGEDRRPSVQLLDPATESGHREVPVQTGISNGRMTEILDGLDEDAEILLP